LKNSKSELFENEIMIKNQSHVHTELLKILSTPSSENIITLLSLDITKGIKPLFVKNVQKIISTSTYILCKFFKFIYSTKLKRISCPMKVMLLYFH
jgi:hypothetical protein